MQHAPLSSPATVHPPPNGSDPGRSVVASAVELLRQEGRLAVLEGRVLGARATALIAWVAITCALLHASFVLGALAFVVSDDSLGRLAPLLAAVGVATIGSGALTMRAFRRLAGGSTKRNRQKKETA